MTFLQMIAIILFGAFTALVGFKGYQESRAGHAFTLINRLSWLGIFVWADAAVLGVFWTLVSVIAIIANSWWLFLLLGSLFWVVRSIGEAIYWFNQQFSTIDRNPEKNSYFYPIFKNQSVWFVHQLLWQCVAVLALVASLYTGHQWLQSMG